MVRIYVRFNVLEKFMSFELIWIIPFDGVLFSYSMFRFRFKFPCFYSKRWSLLLFERWLNPFLLSGLMILFRLSLEKLTSFLLAYNSETYLFITLVFDLSTVKSSFYYISVELSVIESAWFLFELARFFPTFKTCLV